MVNVCRSCSEEQVTEAAHLEKQWFGNGAGISELM